ncbi:MAG: hypothetical protein ISS82_06285 [Nanoarchaeota archaeon]|nr:hypothetical protein [Nanoarchaeota archaeon]
MADYVEKNLTGYVDRDCWVRVRANGSTFHGKIEGVKFECISLRPVIVTKTVGIKEGDLELRIETEIPTKIFVNPHIVVEPVTDGYIRRMLRTYPIKEKYPIKETN